MARCLALTTSRAQTSGITLQSLGGVLGHDGILEAPINICVTCDQERIGPAIIGRNTIPEAAIYSACGAVQNLWLAARAEGVGVGWVSILEPSTLRKLLGIPPSIVPVA